LPARSDEREVTNVDDEMPPPAHEHRAAGPQILFRLPNDTYVLPDGYAGGVEAS